MDRSAPSSLGISITIRDLFAGGGSKFFSEREGINFTGDNFKERSNFERIGGFFQKRCNFFLRKTILNYLNLLIAYNKIQDCRVFFRALIKKRLESFWF